MNSLLWIGLGGSQICDHGALARSRASVRAGLRPATLTAESAVATNRLEVGFGVQNS